MEKNCKALAANLPSKVAKKNIFKIISAHKNVGEIVTRGEARQPFLFFD